MKKKRLVTAFAVVSLCACSSPAAPSPSPSITPEGEVSDPLSAYRKLAENAKEPASAAVSVRCSYTMGFSDDSKNMYSMDGTFEYTGNDTAHMKQYMNSNGMQFVQEGWFLDGRLYFDYNNVQFYEDMTFDNARELMLVPMTPYSFTEDMTEKTAENGREYVITLKPDKAKQLFLNRYDFYGLKELGDFDMKEAVVTDTFDEEGYFVSEETVFNLTYTQDGSPVDITYESSFDTVSVNKTEVTVSEETKKALSAYVNYKDVDPDAIQPLSPTDDEPGTTAEETFRKRLVSRLGYTESEKDIYTVTYNTNEGYRIDFANKTFTFTRYSISYTYSWKGDVGTMGSCTYRFADDTSSSDCKDTTLETIKDVKLYLEMELYYCGLSLKDLQGEN